MTNPQLKAHCEDVIANPQDHPDWVVDIARLALASLEAEPVVVRCRYHPTPQCDGKWIYIPQAEYIKDETGKYQEQALYTASPLPELKPVKMPQRYTTRIGTDLVSGTEVTRVVMIPDEHGQWLSIYDVEHEFNRVRGIPS